jgi:EpsI family protein
MSYELPGVQASQPSSIFKNSPKVIAAIGILVVCNILLYGQIFFHHSAIKPSIKEFPSRISGWESKDVSYDPKVLSSLDPDKIIYKTYYRNREDPPVTLFIAYYDTLEKADLSHSPIVCFTGQGWQISEAREVAVPLGQSKGSSIKVNEIYLQQLNTSMIAYYWYQSPDRAFANRGFQKLYMFWIKMWGRSDENAFVRVTVPVRNRKSEQEIMNYLSSFVKALYPALRKYFL